MSITNSTHVPYAKPTIFYNFMARFCMWRDRRRLAHRGRRFAELPLGLFRDVGLEHLRDLKTDPTFPQRIL